MTDLSFKLDFKSLIGERIADPLIYSCNYCNEQFKTKSRLDTHIKRKHLELKDMECDLCEKSFTNNVDVKTHTSSVHSDERPFKCQICQSSFIRFCNLYAHIRETNSRKPTMSHSKDISVKYASKII